MQEILVVEDEPDIRDLIVLHLSREGFRCRPRAGLRAACGDDLPDSTGELRDCKDPLETGH